MRSATPPSTRRATACHSRAAGSVRSIASGCIRAPRGAYDSPSDYAIALHETSSLTGSDALCRLVEVESQARVASRRQMLGDAAGEGLGAVAQLDAVHRRRGPMESGAADGDPALAQRPAGAHAHAPAARILV